MTTQHEAVGRVLTGRRTFLGLGLSVTVSGCAVGARSSADTDPKLNRFQADSQNLRVILRNSQELTAELQASEAHEDSERPGPSEPETMIEPIPGATISSIFGPRVHPILGYTRPHTGLDIVASYGTVIRAALSGTVISARRRGGYGNALVIAHRDAIVTLYAHQSRLLVPEGSTVSQGDPIGLVGSTGMSTGPHLHFEVRENGEPVDPTRFLTKESESR